MEQLAAPPQTWAHGMVIGAGRFAPAGTDAPTYPDIDHPGWSVERTDVGVYKLTFSRKYTRVLAFILGTQENAASDKSYKLTSIVHATATALGYVTITHTDASGAAADEVSAHANNQCHFVVALSVNEEIL